MTAMAAAIRHRRSSSSTTRANRRSPIRHRRGRRRRPSRPRRPLRPSPSTRSPPPSPRSRRRNRRRHRPGPDPGSSNPTRHPTRAPHRRCRSRVPTHRRPNSASLPDDCLLAEIGGGRTVCYTPGTRELLAVDDAGDPLWRFTLPGNDAANTIRGLAYAQSRLVIAATTTTSPDGIQGVEFSTFGVGGGFIDTFPVEVPLQPRRQRVSAPTLRAYGTNDALYLSGQFEATGNGEGDGPRAFLARFDASTGTKEAFRGWNDGGAPAIESTGGLRVRVVRDGLSVELDPRSLTAVDSPIINAGNYESVFAEARRHLEGEWLHRVGDALRATDAAVGPATPAPGTPVSCPGSGTVTSFTNVTGGLETIYYTDCSAGPYRVNGAVRVERVPSNNSLETITRYEGLVIANGSLAFSELTVDAEVRTTNFGAGRQPCQGSGGDSIGVTLDRFALRGSRANVSIVDGRYRASAAQVGTYTPATNECTYETVLTGSGQMNVVGLFDDGQSWLVDFERSSRESARLSVTAADRSELVLVGALDGLALDDVSIRGADAVATYRPSWRVGPVFGVWGTDR